jgi:hypothetical protein
MATFAAGTYNVSSTINWPCGVSISGPTVAYSRTPNQTAIINWTGTGSWAFQYPSSCSTTGVVFQYMQVAGSRPAGGGGAIYLANGGGTAPTITDNYFWGINADTYGDGCAGCGEIYVDGTGSNQGHSVWSGLGITWNVFGSSANGGDCANLMSTFFYPSSWTPGQSSNPQLCSYQSGYSGGGPCNTNTNNYNNAGGECAAVSFHTSTTNAVLNNNITVYLEEGFKFQEPSPNGGQIGCGSPGDNQYLHTNLVAEYNDFGGIHRIPVEGQDTPCPGATTGSGMTINYNVVHDQVNPGYGSWMMSLPQYNGSVGNQTNIFTNETGNLFLQNVAPPCLYNYCGSYIPSLEFWGNGQANYNLGQGNALNCTVAYGYGLPPWSASYNIHQGTDNNPTVCQEEGDAQSTPTITGNTSTSTISAMVSPVPTLVPSGGTATSWVVNSAGSNLMANVNAWCTTDGSPPVPGSGTAKFYLSGTGGNIGSNTTVKCVGMWGQANQPTSYAASYGFVPSASVSATYNSCSSCTSQPSFDQVSGNVVINTSTPGAGIWYTTDGTTPVLPAGGVPAGNSSSYTPMCQPITQPPIGNLKNITSYGASTGSSDNTAAIESACSAAGTGSGTGIYIPAGTFHHTSQLTLNCNVYGQGSSSELYCPSPTTNGTNCQMYTTGSNLVWSNFSHQMPFTTRDASNFNIQFQNGSNNTTDTLMLVGGNAGGIYNQSTTNQIDTNNAMFNTGADCNIHNFTTNDVVDHTYVYNCGDDGISNFSYTGDPPTAGTLVQWNAIWNEPTARGIDAQGNNITVKDNLVENNAQASGILVTDLNGPSNYSPAVSNVLVEYNDIVNSSGSVYGASILLQASTLTVSNLSILGNIISDSANRTGILTESQGGTVENVSLTNNTIGTSGSTFTNVNSGGNSTANVQCTGNTPTNSGGACGGTNSSVATGSPVTYSGCVVGTAVQYTGPFAPTSPTIKAIAVFPGLTNSAVVTFSPGLTTAAPTFTPASGTTFSSTQSVTLTDSTPSSSIFYYTSTPAIQIITSVGPTFTDSSGYVWSLASTNGGQMVINGTTIPSTYNVIEMVYVNGNVWEENTSSNWYEVLSVVSPTVPTVNFSGTITTSPIPAFTGYSSPITLSASSSITAYATAPGYSQSPTIVSTYNLLNPAFTGCSQGNSTSTTSINVGGYVQQQAYCTYAGVTNPTNCTTTDQYGSAVSTWGTSNSSILSIGAVGAATGCSVGHQGPGCVSGVAAGSASARAAVGSTQCSPWTFTVSAVTPTLSSVTMSLQGGGSVITVGNPAQACVNMAYTSPTENTQVCGAGTDIYGTTVSNYTSSSPSNATIVSSTGVLSGVAAGATNISATAGTFTAPLFAVTVNPATANTPVIVNGPVRFQGTVTIGP